MMGEVFWLLLLRGLPKSSLHSGSPIFQAANGFCLGIAIVGLGSCGRGFFGGQWFLSWNCNYWARFLWHKETDCLASDAIARRAIWDLGRRDKTRSKSLVFQVTRVFCQGLLRVWNPTVELVRVPLSNGRCGDGYTTFPPSSSTVMLADRDRERTSVTSVLRLRDRFRSGNDLSAVGR